ncbi:AMP-binding protein, partial [Halomonas sp. THAF12]|uniref:AMP-binding protein n=1 Tax=Halomonas sp. B23F22_10 TaxID=3459515 RepID=UPI00373F6A6E
INGYGPTENTVFTCCHVMEKGEEIDNSVPIGKPISNTSVYILDSNLTPVPPGVVGELYLGGEGVAKGYLNLSEVTKEKFIPNPFSDTESYMYRSGDLGKFLSNGEIEYLGRTDNQLKMRGYRIEPGEIETTLYSHHSIEEALVTSMNVGEDTRLVGYVVTNDIKDISGMEIKEYLSQYLPRFMVPSVIINLNEMPLNPNGKVDRERLPSPDMGEREIEIVQPITAEEKELSEMWGELLVIQSISLYDDFFELGGHSLRS